MASSISSPCPLKPTPPDPPETINALSHPQHRQRHVTFQLPHKNIDHDITSWRRGPCAQSVVRQQHEKATYYPYSLNCPLTARLLKRGVLDILPLPR